MARTLHPMWPPGVVETVCRVLADTSYPGLTGSEIGRLLAMRGFQDVAPAATKWRRLEAAMQTRQQADRASNCLIRFITDAMEPSRYVDDPARFHALRDSLTEALALVGLKINDKGQVARAVVASTLDDVARLAGRLQTELRRAGSTRSGPYLLQGGTDTQVALPRRVRGDQRPCRTPAHAKRLNAGRRRAR